MRRILIGIALLLVAFRVPGAAEAVESLAHAASYGHFAHEAAGDRAVDGHDRHSTDPEHGCAGDLHVCMCCGHAPLALAMSALAVPRAPLDQVALAVPPPMAGPHGVRAFVFRPPIV